MISPLASAFSRHPLLVVAAAASLVGPAPASVEPAWFAWSRTLAPPPDAVEGDEVLASIVLDEAIFRHSDSSFGDLRIFDGGDREVPRLVRRRRASEPVVEETPVPVEIAAFRPLDDGSVEILVHRRHPGEDEAPPPAIASFDLVTDLRDFEKTVHVEARDAAGAWIPVTPETGALVYDYARFLDLRSTRVEVTPGDFDDFRLRITDATDVATSPIVRLLEERRDGETVAEREHRTLRTRTFRLERLTAAARRQSVRRVRDLTQPFPVHQLAVRRDPDSGDTFLDFAAGRVPVAALTLTTPSDNFARPVEVDAATAEDPERWVTVASRTLVSVRTPSRRHRDLDLPVNRPGRYAHYRVRIRNGDNPPLAEPGIALTGESWEAVFFADPARSHRVLYGGADLEPPRHDVAAVLREAPGADTVRFTLGPETANPEFRADAGPAALPSKTILIVVILGVSALLALAIARFSRSVGDEEPP